MPIARLGAADAAAARRVLSASVLRVSAPGGGGAGTGAPGLPAVAPLHMGLDFWAGQGEGCAGLGIRVMDVPSLNFLHRPS